MDSKLRWIRISDGLEDSDGLEAFDGFETWMDSKFPVDSKLGWIRISDGFEDSDGFETGMDSKVVVRIDGS